MKYNINDLPDNVVSLSGIKIFADDTKLYLAYVDNETSPLTQSLQTFCSWSQTWQLSVAYKKCSVISFGSQSDIPSTPYSLSGSFAIRISSIRGLTLDLKPSTHCSSVAAMAFNRSSLLLKGFHSNDVSVLVRLYKVYVRPLLESSIQVWNPWLHKDIKCIERVQRFFTRAIYKRASIPYMDYGNCLANLGLQSLEYRRILRSCHVLQDVSQLG